MALTLQDKIDIRGIVTEVVEGTVPTAVDAAVARAVPSAVEVAVETAVARAVPSAVEVAVETAVARAVPSAVDKAVARAVPLAVDAAVGPAVETAVGPAVEAAVAAATKDFPTRTELRQIVGQLFKDDFRPAIRSDTQEIVDGAIEDLAGMAARGFSEIDQKLDGMERRTGKDFRLVHKRLESIEGTGLADYVPKWRS